MAEVVTIRRVIVPSVPSACLSPNWHAKHGYYAKRKARVDLQQTAWAAALELRGDTPLVGNFSVTACICWPKGRPRLDVDNLAAMTKGVWDGFTDAGYWHDDRQMVSLTVTQERLDKAGNANWPAGCIVCDIEEVSNG